MKVHARSATAIFTIMVACWFTSWDWFRNAQAADSEDTTWGANGPTWSPDGKRLAFTLYGSIWQVATAGGTAEQISASAGYHAHPAWSPKGDKIAFVRGVPPRGSLPNVAGTLVLVDPVTGLERELETPYLVAGTLAWSPDGTRIACGLSVPNASSPLMAQRSPAGSMPYAGSLLHEIVIADRSVRQIQFRPARLSVGPWVYAAWSPKNNEIFFAAEHIGAPQIWLMPSTNPPVMIQSPLTSYRTVDAVWLDGISALPDGSGVIYSADLQNGRGNYELYRVSRAGGKPIAITNTPRDEFAPAISPDGQRIAFVSNERGNIDLFLMPVSGGKRQHVRITGLKFRRSSGRVHVEIHDEFGNPTPARLYVQASDGKAYAPQGSRIYYYPLDPNAERQGFFLASGDDTFPVPAGRLRLTALKGVEYRIAERTVDVASDDSIDLAITMRRWTNWNQRGWYAGENHFHGNYKGIYYQRPKESLRWLEAEDLNVANMLVANADGACLYDKEFFRGVVDPLSTTRYVLYWGEEYRNSDPLGHMVFLNLKRLVAPFFTSVPGSNSPYDYPLNTAAALHAREQGGFVSYTHPMGDSTDVFDSWLGAKEVPIAAALGGVDAIDIMPIADANSSELWYRLLNCGFKIAPGAGTDAFASWRGIDAIPGAAREYVDVGPVMNWDRWLTRYREGRNFVTNGPLLTFEVNGQPMGSEIIMPRGQAYRAKLQAEVTARVPLRLVEFIQNGQVIKSQEVDPQVNSSQIENEVMVDRSCWFAVRVTGWPTRGVAGDIPRAYSGPVYVRVGPAPTLIKEDLELMIRWIDRLWAYLEERNNFGSKPNREQARKIFAQARQHYEAKLLQAK
jgi:dipeptidyl aminopeptidase/acylaminoacyl peptidase